MLRFSIIITIIFTAPLCNLAVGFARSLASAFRPRGRSSIHVGHRDEDVTFTAYHRMTEASLNVSASTWGSPPYLAVLTEPDACASVERVEETISAIDKATMDGGVDLVVVRVADEGPEDERSLLKWALLKNLAKVKQERRFLLVVNDDVDIVLRAISQNITVDGVHVKEYKSHLIPSIRSKLEHAVVCAFNKSNTTGGHNLIVGTSCHSLESAMSSYQLLPRGPDYLFVGTCYLTQSHPEKEAVDQLEGPALPGIVRRELNQIYDDKVGSVNADAKISQSTTALSPPPITFAIGGIDERNCHEPVVKFGANGVATIRTVMQSTDPRQVVVRMKNMMQTGDGEKGHM